MGIDAEMFVRVNRPVSDDEIKTLRWEMCEAFYADKFWIFREPRHIEPRHAMERIDVYEQDGDDILPDEGETFLRVYPCTRYYGPGYERGDLPFLVSLASWLEARTGGAVWYGGDSSGVVAKPFDAIERALMFDHFVRVGHLPYRGDPRGRDHRTEFIAPHEKQMERHCKFCDMPMARNGWGQGYAGFDCYGCGAREETRDDGKTWEVKGE